MIPRPLTERTRRPRTPNINLRNTLFHLKRRWEAGRAWQCDLLWCPPCPPHTTHPTLPPLIHAWGWLLPPTTTPSRIPWWPSFPQTPNYSPPHVSHAWSCLPAFSSLSSFFPFPNQNFLITLGLKSSVTPHTGTFR